MNHVIIASAVFLLMALTAETWQPKKDRYGECIDIGYISINITVVNSLVEPTFEHQIRVENQLRQPLIHFLERAVYLNSYLMFAVTFYAKDLGYMVDTINNLTANYSAVTYWKIISVTNNNTKLNCGVSSYIPADEEVILFNFTKWYGPETENDTEFAHCPFGECN